MARHEVNKYRQTLISCEKALWFIFVVSTNQTFNDKKVKAVSFIAEVKCGTVVTQIR